MIINILDAETIVDDTAVGVNVHALNTATCVRQIDAWPGREAALVELEGYRPVDPLSLDSASDETIAGALIRWRFDRADMMSLSAVQVELIEG